MNVRFRFSGSGRDRRHLHQRIDHLAHQPGLFLGRRGGGHGLHHLRRVFGRGNAGKVNIGRGAYARSPRGERGFIFIIYKMDQFLILRGSIFDPPMAFRGSIF